MQSTILLISPEPWSAHTVSKHHYAYTLAQMGNVVCFLEPPTDSDRLTVRKIVERLFVVSGPRVAVGIRFYPPWMRRMLEKHWLSELEDMIARKVDVIWLFENSRFFDMHFAGHRLKIYHQVDLNQNFYPLIAANTADICFCVTDTIHSLLRSINRRVYKIQHGVSINPFDVFSSEEKLAYFHRSDKNVVYVGNLDSQYLDIALLSTIVKRWPGITFHFVGGYSETNLLCNELGRAANVVWWGKVESGLVAAILAQSDVLLVTYKHWLYPEQLTNSHKLMEYLASGKVVVATYTDEYRDKRHLLEMVDSNEEFPERFAHVVEHLDVYNSAERQAERRAYAADNTYQRQIERVFDHIRRELPGRI